MVYLQYPCIKLLHLKALQIQLTWKNLQKVSKKAHNQFRHQQSQLKKPLTTPWK